MSRPGAWGQGAGRGGPAVPWPAGCVCPSLLSLSGLFTQWGEIWDSDDRFWPTIQPRATVKPRAPGQLGGWGRGGRREEEAIRVIIIRLTPLLSTYLYLTSFYSKSISKFYQIAVILDNKMYTLSTKQFVHVLKLGLLDKHFTSIATTKGSKSSAKRFYDIYLF